MTKLTQGNKALRDKDYQQAIACYIEALKDNPELSKAITPNITIAQQKLSTYEARTTNDFQGSLLFVINNYDLATQKYRVHNFIQPLIKFGWTVKVIKDKDALNEINTQWDIIVLNRVAAQPKLLELQKEYRLQGGILIYDIDDLIFNPDKACLQDSFKKHDIQGQNTRLAAMKLIQASVLSSDFVTVTTDALALEVQKMGQRAFVIPNSIPPVMPLASNKKKDIINICYLSGTATHDRDFKECEVAIVKVLNSYDNIAFNIVGALVISDKLEDHKQLIRHKLMHHEDMLVFLSTMDINIAPLELGNEFTECKSPLKIFEAAYYNIPTIASATSVFSDTINHGKNGFLAHDSKDWHNALVLLIESKVLRCAIGNHAKKTIAIIYQTSFVAIKLHVFYLYLLNNNHKEMIKVTNDNLYHYVKSKTELIASLVNKSELLNETEYKASYPDLHKTNGVDHYINYGCRETRKSSQKFDGWWYDISNGEYNSSDINYNGIIHALFFAKSNKALFSTPRYIEVQKNYCLPKKIKRACLFAGYDVDGVIDITVIDYIKELAKYCDVYYFADSHILDVELNKLTPFVQGAWAKRHNNYDFGSYKLLLTEKIGWDAIEKYDEVILANDSVYLLTNLREVFSKMESKNCSWWGLQATKGLAFTKNHISQNHVRNISQEINEEKLKSFEETPYYDFLVGSYFIVFRNNVLRDSGFRKIIESISFVSKKKLILDYEVGITRYLLGRKFKLDLFIEKLHSFHPIYTENQIHLISNEGFPFLKRYLLTDNHYYVPQLKKLLEKYKLLSNKNIINHLKRITDHNILKRNLNLSLLDSYQILKIEKLSNSQFVELDKKIVKDPNLWIFPVCFFDHLLTGNDRALFEYVKNDVRIRKVVLTRSKDIYLSGVNVHFYNIDSAESQRIILNAKNIFLKHGPRINIPYPCEYQKRNFINLWHGIPLKRLGISSLDAQGDRFQKLINHNKPNKCVISSSKVDKLAMTSAFYPLTYNEVHITGLPRIDFITMPDYKLPIDMRKELKDLNNILAGRKLILYAPTFRNAQEDAYFEFSEAQLHNLKSLLDENNAILGVREHMADTTKSYNETLSAIGCINLSSENYVNIEILYRIADVLITDYSSCYIDYLTTRKPIVSFAYDLESYMNEERGFYYDIHEVFPSPVCTTFESMLKELAKVMNAEKRDMEHYERVRSLFFDFDDQLNSQRVANLTHSLG